MYCRKCGAKLEDTDKKCPFCGEPVQPEAPSFQTHSQDYYASDKDDAGSIGWAILGFFIPIVGLILFCIWHSERPTSAKQAGIGALISVIFSFIMYAVLFGYIFNHYSHF
ncbi:MAG: zinc-ribbon domain-containing protein [Anaeroplasmataceae bacterium]|nr:zinc-ribbon domain-containing protein [Anaeroplasmataceae bacterium]